MNASPRIIDLAWTGSLYEPSSDLMLGRLEKVAGEVKVGEIVLLSANADCHDYSNSWLAYLRDDAVWLDLMSRLQRWHLLLVKILQSRAKWFFIGSGDVVGSWWELAMACHGRVSTNPYAKVGFPELYIDLFPPLCVLGLRKSEPYDGPSMIRKNAILHVRDAFKAGAVDLCLLTSDWSTKDQLPDLMSWFLKHGVAADLKGNHLQPFLKEAPSIEALEKDRSDAHIRREWLRGARIDDAFSKLRERGTSHRIRSLGEIRAAAAMRYLMADYRAWLSRRVTRYRLGLHDRWWSLASDLISIDVSEGLPPQDVVIALLLRRKRIAFISRSPVKLREALDTIRSRFDRRNTDGRDAFELWNHAVYWMCVPADTRPLQIQCAFFPDDRVVFSRGSVVKSYFRISGNYGSAGIGWYEELSDATLVGSEALTDLDEINETISLMANGILKADQSVPLISQSDGRVVPITVALRFLLLEYLIRLADLVPRCETLADLLKMLNIGGWGFSSDPYQWDMLLKHYRFGSSDSERLAGFFENSDSWRIIGLNTIFDLKVKSPTSKRRLDFRSGAAVTRHLGIFAHRVVYWLVEKQFVSTLDEADLFVTLAWGYPGTLPLPQSLKIDVGSERVEYWQQQLNQIQDSPNP